MQSEKVAVLDWNHTRGMEMKGGSASGFPKFQVIAIQSLHVMVTSTANQDDFDELKLIETY